MNKIPNRQAICEVLMDRAKEDKNIVVLCSDSRGSASMTPFADAFPEQFVETGIAEQNLVSISAGLAKCGKKEKYLSIEELTIKTKVSSAVINTLRSVGSLNDLPESSQMSLF